MKNKIVNVKFLEMLMMNIQKEELKFLDIQPSVHSLLIYEDLVTIDVEYSNVDSW